MKSPARLLLAAAAAVLSSCAGGQKFAESKSTGAVAPKNGKGLVLIYWEPGFVSAAFKPYIYVNGAQLPQRLRRGGFITQDVQPGMNDFAFSQSPGESTSKTKTQAVVGGILLSGVVGGAMAVSSDIKAHSKHGIALNILPNETHYVQMVGAGGKLQEVPKATGEQQIQSCHWLNPGSR